MGVELWTGQTSSKRTLPRYSLCRLKQFNRTAAAGGHQRGAAHTVQLQILADVSRFVSETRVSARLVQMQKQAPWVLERARRRADRCRRDCRSEAEAHRRTVRRSEILWSRFARLRVEALRGG